jgi:outer membrane biosynthesis protein TonB
MFPNVRLMIAAVAASVLALCCGFAMFAAFRVNHEPISRLAAGNAPLQLAADSTAPSAATLPAGQPFGARFELIQAQPAAAPAQAAAVVQDLATAPDAKQDDAAVPPPEPPAAVAATTTTDTAAIEPAPTPEPEQAAPAEQAASAEQTPPAEPAASAAQPTQAAATETTAETTAATEPQTATTAAAASPAEVRQKTLRRQRLAARARRARVAIARAIAQPNGGNAVAPRPSFRTARSVSPASGIGGPFVPPANH